MLIDNMHVLWPKHVVYALLKEGYPRYIGQTENLSYRLRCHKKDGKQFDQVWFTECRSQKDAYQVEAYLIWSVKPAENIRIEYYIGAPNVAG